MQPRMREFVFSLFEGAVSYGLRRAFKHRDDEPSEEALEAIKEQIVLSLENSFDEHFIWNRDPLE